MNKCIIKNRSAGLIILVSLLLLQACSAERRTASAIDRRFKKISALNRHYVGLAVYSEAGKKMIIEHHADEYFTPASNTKLFTFYGGLKLIPNRIPALRYIERGDSLIFWGTGDPSFLQTQLKGNTAYEFLRQSSKKLYFAAGRYTGKFYGKGWQWDDYNDYYQAEINELPLMDNLVAFQHKNGQLQVSPPFFRDLVRSDSASKDTVFSITRDFNSNVFVHPAAKLPLSYAQQVPYKVSLATTLALLADTLHREVGVADLKMPKAAKTLYGLQRDSVLKEMMLPSDNFIAEQLLLVYADVLGQELNADLAIAHIEKNYLSSLPDKPRWIDGSGLSRYNLFTPRDIIELLKLIYKEYEDPKKLYELLPAGGNRGTLKTAYPKTEQPFVFGKTGSFSNNYNQSGYLISKKGKTYFFSFMNNNFVNPTAELKKAMAELMIYIHEKL